MSNTQASLFQARDAILNMTLIETLGGGIYSAIFWFTMYMLFFHKGKQKPRAASTFLIIIPLYVLSMVHLAVRWTVARLAFVVNGNTADDIFNGFVNQPEWCIAVSVVSFLLMTLMADFVTVWRCWVIWNRDWRVAAVPLLLIFTGTAFCIMSAAFQIDPNSGLATSQFNKYAKYGFVYFILSLCSTAISTTLIVFRIITTAQLTGSVTVKFYKKLLEILVESAALYCIALIVYLPFLLRDSFNDAYSQAVLTTITGIAPTLITARVSLGVAKDYTVRNQSDTIVAQVAAGDKDTLSSKTKGASEIELRSLENC